jgi:hypothetical protein
MKAAQLWENQGKFPHPQLPSGSSKGSSQQGLCGPEQCKAALSLGALFQLALCTL